MRLKFKRIMLYASSVVTMVGYEFSIQEITKDIKSREIYLIRTNIDKLL